MHEIGVEDVPVLCVVVPVVLVQSRNVAKRIREVCVFVLVTSQKNSLCCVFVLVATVSRSCEYACGLSNHQIDEKLSRKHHIRTVSRSCEYACAFQNTR